MLNPDPRLSDISLRNWQRIQQGHSRLRDGKGIQIEGVQFRLRLRCKIEEDPLALGLVLVGKDERGIWLPAHS